MDKKKYVKPEILATYSKEELEETIKPHGSTVSYSGEYPDGGGCGCGNPSVIEN